MVVLKKVKASSLNEVLVATVIIVLVFGIAMVILSNLLKSLSIRESHEQNTVLKELIYQYDNDKIKVPYISYDGKFNYTVTLEKGKGLSWLTFEVTAKKNKKTLVKKIIVNEKD